MTTTHVVRRRGSYPPAGSKEIPGLFAEKEEAERLSVTTRTLRRWRRIGYGPAVTKIGRFYFYTATAHEAWLASQERPVELPAPRMRRGPHD